MNKQTNKQKNVFERNKPKTRKMTLEINKCKKI